MKTEHSKKYVFMCDVVSITLHCIICVTTKSVALRGGLAGRPLARVRNELLPSDGLRCGAGSQSQKRLNARSQRLSSKSKIENRATCHGVTEIAAMVAAVVDVSLGCHQRSPAILQ